MLDLTKPISTRDGREAHVWSQGGAAPYTLVGAIKEKTGLVAAQWKQDGCNVYTVTKTANDLINPPQRIKRSIWVNVYPGGSPAHRNGAYVGGWLNKPDADLHAFPDRIACIQIEINCLEGEGL